MRTKAGLLLAFGLAVAGCSVDAADTARAGDAAPGDAAAARHAVPEVEVIDVATGRPVALRAQLATDRPTLLWMWAPH